MPTYRKGRGYAESSIRYEDRGATAKFGSGLDDAEALAIITLLALFLTKLLQLCKAILIRILGNEHGAILQKYERNELSL